MKAEKQHTYGNVFIPQKASEQNLCNHILHTTVIVSNGCISCEIFVDFFRCLETSEVRQIQIKPTNSHFGPVGNAE